MIQLATAAVLSWLALAGPRPVPPPPADATAATRLRPAALPADLAPRAPHAGARLQEPDRWLAEDKLRHFIASFGGFNLVFGALRATGLEREPAMVGAAAVAGAAGFWKEWRDRRAGGPFSGRDLVWDGLGILAGLAFAANTR